MAPKTTLKTAVLIWVLVLGIHCTTAAGGVIYVDADASTGGDGTTWGTAYKYLQDALAVAQDGNDVWVAHGVYKPDANTANPSSGARTATFQLINGVAIYGGFAGSESSLNERDWQTNETILSGDLNGDDVGFTNNGENSYHVVTGSGTDANAVLDGFTVTAGNANGPSQYTTGSGGGMYNYSGSPTVANCTFIGNSAARGGSGMLNYENSSPAVSKCVFSGNSATDEGGGMDNYQSSPTVTNCTFIDNSADYGGGMQNYDCSPTVTMVINCTFCGNSSTYGGGIWNAYSSPTITNCTFSGNSATTAGGGMRNYYANSTVTNCILWGNTSPTGPEVHNYSCTPTVSYSHIGGADPMFVDADGPDNTVGTEDDNLRLLPGSPCIDAGDNTAVPGGVTTDLSGKPRFIEDPLTTDTGNGTAPIVDMGAYEYDAGVIFVDADANGANDGTTWHNAYNHLQDAVADPCLVGGDEIWVAEGTYKPDANTANPDGTGDREATFQLLNGVGIYGGYAGYWASDPDARDVGLYETILSGDINTRGDSSDNSYTVVTGSGTDANAVLDGFTITAGNADGSDPHDRGGGMYNNSGSPMVTNCTFTRNSASSQGGGMRNEQNSSPTLSNCTLSGNSAESGGGMLNGEQSSPTLINCNFSGNSATAEAGGMFNSNSSPTLTNCTFSGNSATDYGGGICNYNSSSPAITNCTFTKNSSADDGAGMSNVESSPTITNCTFSGNSSNDAAAGMYNYNNSSPTLKNCTFSGNSAFRGGGMYNELASSPVLSNCMLWGNTASSGAQIYNDGTSSATVSYSDVEGCGGSGAGWDPNCGIDDGNNIDQDPVFVDANGLDGIGGTADDEEGYVHLRGYSPCINAGDPGGDYSSQVDIDNQPRVAYDVVDMGADEVFPIAGDYEPDGDVDFPDFAYFANHWLLGK